MAAGLVGIITGGGGFVGSHLAELLVASGWRVVAIDDFSTGSARNLASLRDEPRFDLVQMSVHDEPELVRATRYATHIFHLASPVGVNLVVDRPVDAASAILRGTTAVLEAARARHTPTFLASTSEVYGHTARQPLREVQPLAITPLVYRSSYALAKALGEVMAAAYLRDHGVPFIVGRLFNAIGPRQRGHYGMVVPSFVGQALKGDPLVVHGDGRQRRCFTYVGDTALAIARLMETPAATGRVVNIGSTVETSILDLANLVIRLTGSSSERVHVPYEAVHGEGTGDVGRRLPSTDLLYALTSLRCSTPLEESVRRIVASLRAAQEATGRLTSGRLT